MDWPIAYPRATGTWTVRDGNRWGRFDPESGRVTEVNPVEDPDLPGMSAAVDQGELIGYRAGRRAIVATPTHFIKVVRPRRAASLVAHHDALAPNISVRVPAVMAAHADGRIELTAVPGRSLHDQLRTNAGELEASSIEMVAEALAHLHRRPAPPHLTAASAAGAPAWVDISRRHRTEHFTDIEAAATQLEPIGPIVGPPGWIHGDLHDKNIFGPTDSSPDTVSEVSLIDLDGLALGDPTTDVANLAVHLELRGLQGGYSEATQRVVDRFVDAYRQVGALDLDRLDRIGRHTWFRLACLYQYRVGSAELVPELLGRSLGRGRQTW